MKRIRKVRHMDTRVEYLLHMLLYGICMYLLARI